MRRSQTVQHYAQISTTITSYPDLQEMMEEATPRLGFDYFAITHYVPDPLEANVVDLSSFPERWASLARARNYNWNDSPIFAACKVSVAGFVWRDIARKIALSPKQYEALNAARQRGIGDGFTAPCTLQSGVSGSVSYAMDGEKPAPFDFLHAAQYIAGFAYEAGLRISTRNRFPTPPPPELTTRQLECVLLVARGKTDWEIGMLLGISKETAHKHIQLAMNKLGVTSRTQMVVRALFDSHLTFGDVLK